MRYLKWLNSGLVLILTALCGCRQDMHNQPRYKPLADSSFFADGRSARPVIDGTVARGQMRVDEARYTGFLKGAEVNEFPFPITRTDLERGRQRFDIYCSPCHGRLGDGQGLVVKRGFKAPPSYLSDRVMKAPLGHYFDVVTNGFGAMPSYASRVNTDDRWRVIAYVKTLQFAQNAAVTDIAPDKRPELTKTPRQQLEEAAK